jgi:protein phosphatase PTC7
MRLVRGGRVIFATDPLQHQFNMPMQLANAALVPQTDSPSDAQVATSDVLAGDIAVMASDGFFDNVWSEDLCEIVAKRSARDVHCMDEAECQALAEVLVAYAAGRSRDTAYRSPFSVERSQQPSALGLLSRMIAPKGGKQDDITVVVAQMQG